MVCRTGIHLAEPSATVTSSLLWFESRRPCLRVEALRLCVVVQPPLSASSNNSSEIASGWSRQASSASVDMKLHHVEGEDIVVGDFKLGEHQCVLHAQFHHNGPGVEVF